MNCHRVKRSGKPAGWLHPFVCRECRLSQRTDDLLAFGIVQLRKHTGVHAALNHTLALLDLPPIAENHVRLRRQRRRTHLGCAAMATMTVGVAGWFSYMNWTPSEPPISTVHQDTQGYQAFLAANKAIVITADKVTGDINKVEARTRVGPIPEVAAIGSFVHTNAHALELLHANLTLPYAEPMPHSLRAAFAMPYIVYPLGVLLHADAVWKVTQGDREGALDAALQMITFGENVSGGGPVYERLLGAQSQYYGRRIIWHLLPTLSAAEARMACVRMDAASKSHVPLRVTARWERESGLAIRRDIMAAPLWRWQFCREQISGFPSSLEGTDVAFRLHCISNRRIIQDYLTYMDATERELTRPFRPGDNAALPLPEDPVNRGLLAEYKDIPFVETGKETQNALLKTALALQAFHQEHGAYPRTLQALCPTYLSHVPADPFKPGSVLHYHPDEPQYNHFGSYDGATAVYAGIQKLPAYLLYSVGPDGIDQDGAFILHIDGALSSSEKLRVLPNSHGDIVAGINL